MSADLTTIRAIDIIDDLRAGMTKLELMEKYQISPKGLGKILKELATLDVISASEPHEPPAVLVYDLDAVDGIRALPRQPLTIVLPIFIYGGVYDSNKGRVLQKRGTVRDITEKGVGVRGIKARVDEVKTFVIPANDFFEIDPIVFEARCRWLGPQDRATDSIGGFQIVNISETSLQQLRKLLHALDINHQEGESSEPISV
jgi:hypothetical protein